MLGEKHENFIAVVKQWENLAASKVKMSGSEKMKANRNTSNRRAKQPQINVQKSVARANLLLFWGN